MLDKLTLDVLLEASAQRDGALGKALETAIVVAADQTFKEVIGDAIRERDAIEAWIDRAGSLDAALAQLSQTLGVGANETRETLEAEFFSHSLIPAAEWPTLIEILESGSKSDANHVAALQAAHASAGRERIDNYLKVFCTTELEPRKNIVTKKIAEKYPDWLARLQSEQERVCALIARERALDARDRTAALITIAAEVIARYRREKDRRALLDYDDLIDKTLELFARSSAAWVLYKLDLGIDHVLIDEAQDTSPKQWDIVKTITSEFKPGGARQTSSARCLPSATRSSRSSRSRARRRTPSTRCGGTTRNSSTTPSDEFSPSVRDLVPFRRGRARRRRPAYSRPEAFARA